MRYEIYQDRSQLWRWRVLLDGDIIAESKRTYLCKEDCDEDIQTAMEIAKRVDGEKDT